MCSYQARLSRIDVARMIRWSDLVVEVLDARDPLATRNTWIEDVAHSLDKQLILAINKADLVPLEVLKLWKKYFKGMGLEAVFLSAKERLGTRKLIVAIRERAPKLPVRVAVVGYPNVGKSTIINYLKERSAASTSPVPGWTKVSQIYRAKEWLIVADTPGVLTRDTNDYALMVVRGFINPDGVDDPVKPALEFMKRAMSIMPNIFKDAYGISEQDPLRILEELAKVRGRLMKGGLPNIQEAARIIIRDWNSGKLTYYYKPPEG